MTKRELGLPHIDRATERQKRDGMCWSTPEERYNGGQYALNRITRGIGLIPNLSVSLLGGIQPDVIRRLAGESYDAYCARTWRLLPGLY